MSLTWMARFDITLQGHKANTNPFKKQRIMFGRLVKEYGFEGAMQIMQIRADSNKMLLSLLGKKKVSKKGSNFSDAKYIEALYKKLEAVENLTMARRVIKAEMEAGAISSSEAQHILDDVTEQMADDGPQITPDKKTRDPLAALMEEDLEQAIQQAEENGDDDGSVQEPETDNAF